jgi:hypothetical protein
VSVGESSSQLVFKRSNRCAFRRGFASRAITRFFAATSATIDAALASRPARRAQAHKNAGNRARVRTSNDFKVLPSPPVSTKIRPGLFLAPSVRAEIGPGHFFAPGARPTYDFKVPFSASARPCREFKILDSPALCPVADFQIASSPRSRPWLSLQSFRSTPARSFEKAILAFNSFEHCLLGFCLSTPSSPTLEPDSTQTKG